MSLAKGQRVRVIATGLVEHVEPQGYEINFGRRQRYSFDRINWFRDDELEAIDETSGAVPDRGWRDVCADLIRLGKDQEAVALLVEQGLTPYIKALEDLFEAFAKLPSEGNYAQMVQRNAGHFTGKIETREKIEAFRRAAEAWRRIKDLQGDR